MLINPVFKQLNSLHINQALNKRLKNNMCSSRLFSIIRCVNPIPSTLYMLHLNLKYMRVRNSPKNTS